MICRSFFLAAALAYSRFALLSISLLLSGTFSAFSDEVTSNLDEAKIFEGHRTQHGLYATVREAYVALIRNPSIVLIDVRDPIELSVEGYPEPMDINIPVFLISRRFNKVDSSYEMVPNASFSAEVGLYMESSGLSKSHPIFVICRDGSRATEAAELLFEAGYSTVWNIVGAYSTAGVSDAESSEFNESWVGAGLPVKYKIRSEVEWKSWRIEN